MTSPVTNNDLLRMIFRYLDKPEDLSAANRVNKKWNIVSKSDPLWLSILAKINPNEYKKTIASNQIKSLLKITPPTENPLQNKPFFIVSRTLNLKFTSIQKSIKFLKEKNPELHEKFSKLSLPQIKEKGGELIDDLLKYYKQKTHQQTFRLIRKILNLGPNMNKFFQKVENKRNFFFSNLLTDFFLSNSIFPSQLYHGVDIRSVFEIDDANILHTFIIILYQVKQELQHMHQINHPLKNNQKWYYENLVLDFEKFLQEHKINVNTFLLSHQTPSIVTQSMGLFDVKKILLKHSKEQEDIENSPPTINNPPTRRHVNIGNFSFFL